MDFPLATAVAARLDVLPHTGSTNADLVAAAAADSSLPHLAVLLTRDQRAGRGRLDRGWTAQGGSGLAVSVLLRPRTSPGLRGWLPLVAGVAMSEAVAAQLPGRDVGVKWPNDVLVQGRKICGILAEGVLAAAGHGADDPGGDVVVLGAGVNTVMAESALPVPTATSFAALGAVCDEDRLLADYLGGLDGMLRELAAASDARSCGVHERVSAACVSLGRRVSVSLPGGGVLHGEARRIDDDGRLVVRDGSAETAVAAGDVVHARLA